MSKSKYDHLKESKRAVQRKLVEVQRKLAETSEENKKLKVLLLAKRTEQPYVDDFIVDLNRLKHFVHQQTATLNTMSHCITEPFERWVVIASPPTELIEEYQTVCVPALTYLRSSDCFEFGSGGSIDVLEAWAQKVIEMNPDTALPYDIYCASLFKRLRYELSMLNLV
jgi:hypothetical protein